MSAARESLFPSSSSAAEPCGTCYRCGGTLYANLTHSCSTSVRNLPVQQFPPVAPASMCPHCGERFAECHLIPTHDFPKPCRAVCPGSGQISRNAESDRRPLWKDER